MIYKITKKDKTLRGTIHLPSSKSESNRALIIRALCKEKFEIENLSEAEDTRILHKFLNPRVRTGQPENNFNAGDAGTTMRFLTAFCSSQEGKKVILTGSQRMKNRPIKILAEALLELGAEIEYLGKPGFPPLKIAGKALRGGKISVDGSVSSQYISALLMIAPSMQKGLTLEFTGRMVSEPYISMTLKIMEHFGVENIQGKNSISVKPQTYRPAAFPVESDWSAASYWYEMAALAEEVDLTLTGLSKQSRQGDAVVAEMFTRFGVKTTFGNGQVHLGKIPASGHLKKNMGTLDFTPCPDLVQAFAVSCAGLQCQARLTGLKTLRIKETDRIAALHSELSKTGIDARISGDDLLIGKSPEPKTTSAVSTYGDHRMAMSFAPLAMLSHTINIENPDVVKKSYPGFWDDLRRTGFKISFN